MRFFDFDDLVARQSVHLDDERRLGHHRLFELRIERLEVRSVSLGQVGYLVGFAAVVEKDLELEFVDQREEARALFNHYLHLDRSLERRALFKADRKAFLELALRVHLNAHELCDKVDCVLLSFLQLTVSVFTDLEARSEARDEPTVKEFDTKPLVLLQASLIE